VFLIVQVKALVTMVECIGPVLVDTLAQGEFHIRGTIKYDKISAEWSERCEMPWLALQTLLGPLHDFCEKTLFS
jgi:predicted methyltransferase MtxX (methanogen marker protein 4)